MRISYSQGHGVEFVVDVCWCWGAQDVSQHNKCDDDETTRLFNFNNYVGRRLSFRN